MCTAFAHPFCACYLCQKRPISVKRDLISCTAFAHPFCVRAMKSKSVHYHKEKENKGSVYREYAYPSCVCAMHTICTPYAHRLHTSEGHEVDGNADRVCLVLLVSKETYW